MKSILARLNALFITLFGKMSWNKPLWLTRLLTKFRQHPLKFSSGVLVILIMSAYLHLPKPALASAEINAPEITAASDELQPIPALHVTFSQRGMPQSVAPLDKINKTIAAGIHLSPDLPGKWRWESDSELSFKPDTAWPAGQTYTLTFQREIFAPHVKLEKYSYAWRTQDFSANIRGLTLYQNPKNAAEQQIVATIAFNYPVDTHDIIKHIALIPQNGSNLPLTITFGKRNREADIASHSRRASLSNPL